MRFMNIKKIAILCTAASIVSLTYIPSVIAQGDASVYLQQIADNTKKTAANLENIPTFLQNIGRFIDAWMNPDDSDATITMQKNFTELGNLFTSTVDKQKALQASLNSSLLNNEKGRNVFKVNSGDPITLGIATKTTLAYANDLVYSTLLNNPFFPDDSRKAKKVDPALNYIKNASGMNIYHVLPEGSWQGKEEAQIRYQSFFNVVNAVESFNSYVLSNQYEERNQFNDAQTKLIAQASDPTTWFTKVGSENIGFVLRQLLIYQSQIFILLTESLKLQKQMVTAQVMTNTLLIATNQTNENMMLSYAMGERPQL